MQHEGFIREIRLVRDRVDDFSAYPYSIPAIGALETIELNAGVTIFVGENGSGKSTLIEAIAISAGLNPEGGTKNLRYANRPSESALHQALRMVRGTRRERSGFFLRAETMFNIATQVEALGLGAYGWQDMHARSHGEAFLWIVQNRFPPEGLYVLDEPESALSPQRQLALLRLIHDLVKGGSQVIMATHSPILMAYPGATLYSLDSGAIAPIEYEDTEHCTVTRAFLEHPGRMLDVLLSDCE